MVEQVKVVCGRCGEPLLVRGPGNPDAKLMRLATAEEAARGALCANCAATKALLDIPPVAYGIEKNGRESLLNPMIQEAFAAVLKAGQADAKPDELDWALIVKHWDLPFPKPKRVRGTRK